MQTQDAMTRAVMTLAPMDTLRDALDRLRSRQIRHLPVVDGSQLVGIVSDRDVKRATPSVVSGVSQAEYDAALSAITVSQFMTREPLTVTPRSPLKASVALLLETRIGALPVVEEGQLVGILTDTDVLRVALNFLKR